MGLTFTRISVLLRTLLLISFAVSCAGVEDDETSVVSSGALYVATGVCYSGNGVTSYGSLTSSNMVTKLNKTTGAREAVIADYFQSPSNVGDSPVGISFLNSSELLVLVENSTTTSLRRIERVTATAQGARSTWNGNVTALSAQLRKMVATTDGWVLVSKTTDIEKVKDGNNRLLQGALSFIRLNNPPAASNCTTAVTLLSDIVVLPNGMIVSLHAAAGKTGFSIISSTGYAAAGDCRNNVFQASPNAASYPTAAVYDSVNKKLLVSYAGSTTADNINTIYAYTIDETLGSISSPQEIYDSSRFGSSFGYLLFGISAMALDTTTNSLYVSTAITTGTTVVNYRIEKLSYAASAIGVANDTVLQKAGTTFYDYGSDTKCISQMVLE